jgi:hypothetical protein
MAVPGFGRCAVKERIGAFVEGLFGSIVEGRF